MCISSSYLSDSLETESVSTRLIKAEKMVLRINMIKSTNINCLIPNLIYNWEKEMVLGEKGIIYERI